MFLTPCSCSLETGRYVDGMTIFERDDRPLGIAQHGNDAAERPLLALADDGVDGFDLDLEQAFDGSLDFGLRRLRVDLEDHLIGFGSERRFLGNDGSDDDVVGSAFDHLNRSSSAATAALVSTSFLRRRMS